MGLPPEYVLDKMQLYEASAMLEYRHLKSKDNWEQTRWFGTLYANYHSKHRISADELISFPWEKENGLPHVGKSLTREEKEEMNKYADNMQEALKTAKTSSVTLADIKRIEYTTPHG